MPVIHTPTEQELKSFFSRGVAEAIPQQEFLKKLQSGNRMRIYLGVDPTGPSIHVGHAVILRSLRTLQEWGHEIILLIGDFTARIGDPTGRDAARVTLTHEEILKNAETYKEQAGKILDFSGSNPARIDFNANWLAKLTFVDVIKLASQFTVQRMMERDMFEKRWNEGKPIYVHEFLYPLMQGYDSVAMDVDVECGGTDQTFNMLAGRTLQDAINHHEKVVLTFELLEGLDGRKMSKSYNNIIGVMETPNDMFGKIMSVRDDLIVRYFRLCTNVSDSDIADIEKELSSGQNPRDIKMRLAREVIALYHSAVEAERAEAEFKKVFQDKKAPTDIPSYTLTAEDATIVDVLIHVGFATSKSEARRLIEQGGVKLRDEKVSDATVAPSAGTLQAGKRKFVKLQK
ncbi:MAG: tyrosine--tRNA ligase [Candidatus Kerfeldbacteria bacterium]|nr:tyrosine--tRNA ligase [Candidatus Kerfeldbacteria bacterium]